MYFISKEEFAEKTLGVMGLMKKLNSIWNKDLVNVLYKRSVLPLKIASLYNSMRSCERVVLPLIQNTQVLIVLARQDFESGSHMR